MSLKLEIQWATEHVAKLAAEATRLEKEVAALKQPFGTFEEYEPLTYPKLRDDIHRDRAWKAYEAARLVDIEIEKRNAERYQRNMALVKRLVDTITATGISNESREWNGRKRKYERVTANWVNMLQNAMPDGVGSSREAHERNVRSREDQAKKQADHEREASRAAAAEEKERKQTARVVAAAIALGMDVTSTLDDVRCELRQRDKYLDLALGGVAVRGDWNDGPYEAENALSRFKVETDEDRLIVEDWNAILANFDDGRQFRDAKRGYDYVFGFANQELLALWNSLND